jgi:hypothetical protein
VSSSLAARKLDDVAPPGMITSLTSSTGRSRTHQVTAGPRRRHRSRPHLMSPSTTGRRQRTTNRGTSARHREGALRIKAPAVAVTAPPASRPPPRPHRLC